MKQIPYVLSIGMLFILAACGKSGEHAHHHTGTAKDTTDDPNAALYHQVQDVHEELMMKMEDLYNLKKEIQEKINKTPGLVTDQKTALENIAAALDSANEGMMTWMHHFKPPVDSVDREKVREYLETEMEKIKRLKEQTDEAIEKAKEKLEKK